MDIRATRLPGVLVAESKPHIDQRGAFLRLFCQETLAEIMAERRIMQINHSSTAAVGVVRGLHFQHPPHAEMKLVRCQRGRVYDVAVDLRTDSPTFLQWHAEELTPDSGRMLIIPEGCAHGFQTLAPDTELLYLHTAPYVPASEGGIRFDDDRIGVNWPLPVSDLSQRDRLLPYLTSKFGGIRA